MHQVLDSCAAYHPTGHPAPLAPELFRHYWRRKSKSKQRKPRVTQETIDLIKQLAKENPLWGCAGRIFSSVHMAVNADTHMSVVLGPGRIFSSAMQLMPKMAFLCSPRVIMMQAA